jgi:aspartate racemase
MSWESTVDYYRIINTRIRDTVGGLHSASLLLHSFDFAEIEPHQHAGNWRDLSNALIRAGLGLKSAGADFLVICTNTMHVVADEVAAGTGLPLLNIVDAVASVVRGKGVRRIGLLGTRFTMEQPFYRERLRDLHGITATIPNQGDREEIHRIIYEELCVGRIVDASRVRAAGIAAALAGCGAGAVVLGCTELPMLFRGSAADGPIPILDTTRIHAEAVADLATAGDLSRLVR